MILLILYFIFNFKTRHVKNFFSFVYTILKFKSTQLERLKLRLITTLFFMKKKKTNWQLAKKQSLFKTSQKNLCKTKTE